MNVGGHDVQRDQLSVCDLNADNNTSTSFGRSNLI